MLKPLKTFTGQGRKIEDDKLLVWILDVGPRGGIYQ